MEEARWIAVRQNDSTADGRFYYGVKTTGIFCLPSCKSKLPRKENVVFFNTCEEAIQRGFRPCKRCRPDLYPRETPHERLLLQIRDFLDLNSDHADCLANLSSRFGLSGSHLVRIFRERFGVTPREYLLNRRLTNAKALLDSSNEKMIDIALRSGFSSYTTFFTNFKKSTGLSPEEYHQGGKL